MPTGPEMALNGVLKIVFKNLNIDGEKVLAQINGIRGTIDRIGMMMSAILSGVLMANRRLHRIEAHMGLSDIEPVPDVVITHENSTVTVASLGNGDSSEPR